jgi:hypothetical protein
MNHVNMYFNESKDTCLGYKILKVLLTYVKNSKIKILSKKLYNYSNL